MKRKTLITLLMALLMTLLLAVNAFATDSYNYADSLGGTSTTLLTEEGSSTQTWTLYPTIAVNDTGKLDVAGEACIVNASNYTSFIGCFFKDSNGKVFQFDSCNYTPASGTSINGGNVIEGAEIPFISEAGRGAAVEYSKAYNLRVYTGIEIADNVLKLAGDSDVGAYVEGSKVDSINKAMYGWNGILHEKGPTTNELYKYVDWRGLIYKVTNISWCCGQALL